MGRIAMLSLCASLAGGGAASAETAFDLVFRSGTLDGLPQGTLLRYDEGAEVPDGDGPGEVTVDLGPGDSALVERLPPEVEAAPEALGNYPAAVGNPVAMVFLERTVLAISEETGGSPFYIRNRIRDALGGAGERREVTVDWDGGTVPATEVALVPFAQDAHRAELGAFADLEIHVVVSEAVPGWYHSIRAEAPAAGTEPAYEASLSLSGVEP